MQIGDDVSADMKDTVHAVQLGGRARQEAHEIRRSCCGWRGIPYLTPTMTKSDQPFWEKRKH